MHRHLRAAVQFHLGSDLLCQAGRRQILHDQRIHTRLCGIRDGLRQRRQLGGIYRGVYRTMHPHTPGMTKAHRLGQLLTEKAVGCAPRIKIAKPQIYGIGTAAGCGGEHFHITGRG